jgi:hypothetical protein
MIFTQPHIKLIERGLKTQTRRLVREGERAVLEYDDPPNFISYTLPIHMVRLPPPDGYRIVAVLHPNGRTKWEVGRDYAMQPGRTKRAVGRIPPLVRIDLERVREIGEADAVAEGCQALYADDKAAATGEAPIMTAVELYAEVWDEINPRTGDRWSANPLVWVLEWEPPATANIR